MKKLTLLACILFCLSACAPTATPMPFVPPATPPPTEEASVSPPPTQAQPNDSPPLRILFIGNSHTFTNNLPDMFTELARSGGHQVSVSSSTRGGYSLDQHVEDSATLQKIESSGWDFVILQESSQTARGRFSFAERTAPAARTLDEKIKSNGAQTILFMLWASPDTYLYSGIDPFAQAQEGISAQFTTLAKELGAILAPIGVAWGKSLRQSPELALWGRDNVHATPAGTYLMACVLYATIYEESPGGLTYGAELPDDTAMFLQTIAAEVTLTE